MKSRTSLKHLLCRLYTKAVERLRQVRLRPRSDVLVFDELTLEILGDLLDEYKVDVLHVREKRIKLHVAFLAVLEPNFWQNRKMCAYFDAYIRWSGCKVVLSGIDNNSYFLSISGRIPAIRTMFIQASRRSEHGDLFELLKATGNTHKVDQMIVHNKSIGNSLAAEKNTYVCTDSSEITSICDMYSVPCISTPSFETGTDRVAWSAKKLGVDHIVNVQGDEPMLNPSTIKQFVDFYRSTRPDDNTILNGITSIDSESAFDPNNVKAAVTESHSRILYLSRKALPNASEASDSMYYKQLGMYAMNYIALQTFSSLHQSRLELAERVEMLRWIESGKNLVPHELETDSISVDTPADFLRVTNSFTNLKP